VCDFFSTNLNLKMLVTYWQRVVGVIRAVLCTIPCNFWMLFILFLYADVSMEWMIYWMSVRSEWYTKCHYGVNDVLNISIEWMLYWMSVRNKWCTECQYGESDKLNVCMKWMMYWMSVQSEWYIECQYGVNDILNVSTEWML